MPVIIYLLLEPVKTCKTNFLATASATVFHNFFNRVIESPTLVNCRAAAVYPPEN